MPFYFTNKIHFSVIFIYIHLDSIYIYSYYTQVYVCMSYMKRFPYLRMGVGGNPPSSSQKNICAYPSPPQKNILVDSCPINFHPHTTK